MHHRNVLKPLLPAQASKLYINSLPHSKVLDLIKFKAFADDKTNLTKMIVSVFDKLENIVGKGENAGYQHFLLFPQCFQKGSSPGL